MPIVFDGVGWRSRLGGAPTLLTDAVKSCSSAGATGVLTAARFCTSAGEPALTAEKAARRLGGGFAAVDCGVWRGGGGWSITGVLTSVRAAASGP